MRRRYLYTIQESDVNHGAFTAQGQRWWIQGFFGLIQPQDVGKRAYLVGDPGVVQIENNQQRDERVAREGG